MFGLCFYLSVLWIIGFWLFSMYVAMDILVFIVFHFMDSTAYDLSSLILLCYLVYRPQGCNELELNGPLYTMNIFIHHTVVVQMKRKNTCKQ